MKSIIFWDMTLCSLLSCNRRFGWTYRLHLHGRNNFSKNQQVSRWQADGGYMFLRNVGCNSTDYTASYPRRWYSSRLELSCSISSGKKWLCDVHSEFSSRQCICKANFCAMGRADLTEGASNSSTWVCARKNSLKKNTMTVVLRYDKCPNGIH
jgi:hypothetical protein